MVTLWLSPNGQLKLWPFEDSDAYCPICHAHLRTRRDGVQVHPRGTAKACLELHLRAIGVPPLELPDAVLVVPKL